MRDHVVAVDIGTASARAGVFDRSGRLVARAKHPIVMQRPAANHAEHDSEDIWQSACRAVHQALSDAGLKA
ncbi:MAG TPA: FGGY family carbohydrate kinase, partial [Pseudorhizobium sp.]|nr:FGGY family carbohydrate kinase [Pseudorhizobium sp.]